MQKISIVKYQEKGMFLVDLIVYWTSWQMIFHSCFFANVLFLIQLKVEPETKRASLSLLRFNKQKKFLVTP